MDFRIGWNGGWGPEEGFCEDGNELLGSIKTLENS
jgi:hypothetical protein